MSWYGKDLNISPSLVALTGGVGRGFSALGNSLVNLGNQKVARAEKDALDKKTAAKERLAARGLNIKNRLLNPDATNTLAKIYNIDKNSPLYKQGAPSQFNADLGLVDLGKAPTKKAPKVSFVKQNGKGGYTAILNNGSTLDTGIKAPKKTVAAKKLITKDIKGPDGKNYVFKYDYNSGKFVNTGLKSAFQGNKKAKKPTDNLVSTGGLSGAAFMYLRDNNLTQRINGKEYITKDLYKKIQKMQDIGNMKVN